MRGWDVKTRLFWLCLALLLGCAPAGAGEAFITDQTGDEVSVLDLASRQVVARIPISGKPAGIAMARDGRTAYVTSPEAKFVSVIDTVSRKVVARIAIPDTPLGIAADPGGGFIYVAGFYEPRLYKIDLATGTIVATVTVGASPSGVALTSNGSLIVTADRDDDQNLDHRCKDLHPEGHHQGRRPSVRRHHRSARTARLYRECRRQ